MKLIVMLVFMFFSTPQDFGCRVLIPEIAGEYEGQCRNGYAHGIGEARGIDTYNGRFRRGLPHGEGKYTWNNGNYYEGEWKNGLKYGKGTFFDATEETTKMGIWKNNELIRTVPPYPSRELNYKVGLRRNIDRYRFFRIGEGDKIVFHFQEMSGQRRVQNLLIDGSTGKYYSFGNEIGYENVHFPFQGRIRFYTPSKMLSGIIECEIHFTINEPGFWEVTITY